jgi:NAD(P)-dependent dehydrogenase (short-subunit alcohol dehydrogenase family)
MSTPTLVFITGANQGIGYEIALNLAKRGGYHVLVGARRPDAAAEAIQKIKAAGAKGPVDFVHIDVASSHSVTEAVKAITEKYGRLDVLIVRLYLLLCLLEAYQRDIWREDRITRE